MIIGNIRRKDKDTGEVIMILSKRESQEIQNIVSEYCDQNKRKQYAKKIRKELDDNMCIWSC